VGKYGTARQAIDDNTGRSVLFACWIRKDADTHLEYSYFLLFRATMVMQKCLIVTLGLR